jgi:hypothetical protein
MALLDEPQLQRNLATAGRFYDIPICLQRSAKSFASL